MQKIYGHRIQQVRELLGFSQIEFADKVGITQPQLSHIESDRFVPHEDVVTKMSFITGFPISFFRKKPPDYHIPMGSLLFK